jgi:protein transport protein SEC31
VSSAKDNRIICWDPNNATTNGEILYDLPTSGQWCFDVSWSQRNPDLICASSFEGQINVYSLMGGKYNVIHQTSSKIMDSFGVDSSAKQDTPLEVQQQITQTIPQLKIAPKWMKRPCGASFGVNTKQKIQSSICSRIN